MESHAPAQKVGAGIFVRFIAFACSVYNFQLATTMTVTSSPNNAYATILACFFHPQIRPQFIQFAAYRRRLRAPAPHQSTHSRPASHPPRHARARSSVTPLRHRAAPRGAQCRSSDHLCDSSQCESVNRRTGLQSNSVGQSGWWSISTIRCTCVSLTRPVESGGRLDNEKNSAPMVSRPERGSPETTTQWIKNL